MLAGLCLFLQSTGALFSGPLPEFLSPQARRAVPGSASQLIVAAAERPGRRDVRLYLLERVADAWRVASGPHAATIGYKGYAPPGAKREGDGRSPSGIFPAGFAFGYAPSERVRTRLEYRQVTGIHFWDTDPNSPRYNQWIAGRAPPGAHERMRRRDRQYSLGLVIEYNMRPVVPGLGSAIFLHIWRGPGKPTAGCIGVTETRMRWILDWLDPARRPMIMMGTEAVIRSGAF